ncbi:hypothetical protein Dimus_013422 [Dionaea muscipula]
MIEGPRIRLNGWQQAGVALGSAVGALLDPRRVDLIAALGETTGKPAFVRVLHRMKKSLEGRNIVFHTFKLVKDGSRDSLVSLKREKAILAIGDYMNIRAHAYIGGKSVGEDIRSWNMESMLYLEHWRGGCDFLLSQNDILEMASKFMTDLSRILVKRDELTLENESCRAVMVKLRMGEFGKKR